MNNNSRYLKRSREDVVFFGVCAGIAKYFSVETWTIRLLFAFLILFKGASLLLYIILAIVMPLENYKPSKNNDNMENENNNSDFVNKESRKQKNKKEQGNFMGGVILIVIGVIFLIGQYVPNINFGDLWPVILIAIGAVLLRNHYRLQKNQKNDDFQE